MKTIRLLCITLICTASARAAPSGWLEGTVLEECRYCATDAFQWERRKIANQVGRRNDVASAMGYVVTMEKDGLFVWGRAALVGTGNIIRTDAHVLFEDSEEPRFDRVFFEPMQHRGSDNLIEIDMSSVQRGGNISSLQTDVKNDWAIARLEEDAIEKFNGERVFAFLWDYRLTHDKMMRDDFLRATAYIPSPFATLGIYQSCERITDDHPSNYAFGIEEIFFLRCPAEHTQPGSSGSAVAIVSASDTWSLGGQIVASGMSQLTQAGPNGDGKRRRLGHQMYLGNTPMVRQTLTWFYLQELILRGLDPRDRAVGTEIVREPLQSEAAGMGEHQLDEASIAEIFTFLDWQYADLPRSAPEFDQIRAVQRASFADDPNYLKVWEKTREDFDPGFVQWMEENVIRQ